MARLAVFCSSFLFLVPGATMAAQNQYGCEICPTGEKFTETESGFRCVPCDIPENAYALDWPGDYCMAVTCDGTDCYIGMNECPWDCDSGYHLDNGECVIDDVTCDQSYYLPANSNSCELCTQHNYCVGGTFSPSGSDQGVDPCPNGETGNTRLGAYYCVPYKKLNTTGGLNAIMRNTIYPNNPDNFCIKPDGEDGVYYGGLSTEYMDNAIQIDADGQTYWLKLDEEFEGGSEGGGEESECGEAGCGESDIWAVHGGYAACNIDGSGNPFYQYNYNFGTLSAETCPANRGKWEVVHNISNDSYGYPGINRIKGIGLCTNSTDGNKQKGESGNPYGTQDRGDNTVCWCKGEGVGNWGSESAISGAWVFSGEHVSLLFPCQNMCALQCGVSVHGLLAFRDAILAPAP